MDNDIRTLLKAVETVLEQRDEVDDEIEFVSTESLDALSKAHRNVLVRA